MPDQDSTAGDRPSGDHYPAGRSAGAGSGDQDSMNPLEDAPLADRLEVEPERGDVKG